MDTLHYTHFSIPLWYINIRCLPQNVTTLSTRKVFSRSGLDHPSGRTPLLIFRRFEVAPVRVKPLAIVEDLHVFGYFFPSLLPASVDVAPNKLRSQGLEERFRVRVVPAVALAAHALKKPLPLGSLLKMAAWVLYSSIVMKHQPPWHPPVREVDIPGNCAA